MEPHGTVKIFKRSLIHRGVIYERMVCDRDSSTFKEVLKSKPYGRLNCEVEKLDCVNHYVKRFKYHYDKLKNVDIPKIDRSDKRVTLKGVHGLQKSFLISLQVYLGLAIKRNSNDLQGMLDAGWATFYHFCSEEGNQQHDLCPENSWCTFKITGSYRPKNKYLPKLMPHLKPIYAELLKESELRRCLPGLTTNANESFNAQIWRRVPKTLFTSPLTLCVAVYDAILCRNVGYQAREKLLEKLGFIVGRHTKQSLLALDDKRDLNRKKSKPKCFKAADGAGEEANHYQAGAH